MKNKILMLIGLVIFLSSFSILVPTFAKAAATQQTIAMGTGWSFYYKDGDKRTIIATKDNLMTFFGPGAEFFDNNNQTGGQGTRSGIKYSQKLDYYAQDQNLSSSITSSARCLSWVDIGEKTAPNGTTKLGISDLFVPDRNACTGNGNKGPDAYGVTVGTIDQSSDIYKKAANLNFGDRPIGCPDWSGTAPAGSNYNCPSGGAIVNAAYVADGQDPNSGGGGTGGESTDPEAEAADNCQSTVASVFGWVLCPIMGAVADVVGFFENTIQSLLRMDEINTSSPIYQSWASIRNIARSVLVLVALAAIASQIFGFEFMNAYTVRKLIPKIIIAAILIELSFFLAAVGISFVNALGDGVEALILYPFGTIPGELLAKSNEGGGAALYYVISGLNGMSTGSTLVAGLMGVFVVAGAAAGGVAALIMSILIIVAAIFVGFISLVLRKIVLLGLIIVMPLAIAAWILPNTKKWFDSWWSLFSKLLLMYPLIMGLLAVGKAGAYIIATSGTVVISGSIFYHFAADALTESVVLFAVVIAYFGPFFFIPAMFKTAGGIFAKGHSALDGMGKKYSKAAGSSKPVKNLSESYNTRRVNKAVGNTDMAVGKNPIRYLRRTKARSTMGTLGAVGDYGKTKRLEERHNALKKAGDSRDVTMKELGITDYGHQLDYLEAAATGEKAVELITYGKDAYGNDDKSNIVSRRTVAVDGTYGELGQLSAATALFGQRKAGKNRVVADVLNSTHEGRAIFSEAMQEKGGDVKAVSADVAGAPFEGLRTNELLSQDKTSLEHMNSLIDTAVSSGDREQMAKYRRTIESAQHSSDYFTLTDDGSRAQFDLAMTKLGGSGGPAPQPTPGGGAGSASTTYTRPSTQPPEFGKTISKKEAAAVTMQDIQDLRGVHRISDQDIKSILTQQPSHSDVYKTVYDEYQRRKNN